MAYGPKNAQHNENGFRSSKLYPVMEELAEGSPGSDEHAVVALLEVAKRVDDVGAR